MNRLEKNVFYIAMILLPVCSVIYFQRYIPQWYINASALPICIGLFLLLFRFNDISNKILINEMNIILILMIYLIIVSLSNYFILEKSDTFNSLYALTSIFLIFCYVVVNLNKINIKDVIKILIISMSIVVIYGYIQIIAYNAPGSFMYNIYISISNKIDYIWGVGPSVPYVINSFGRINLTTPETSEATSILSMILLPFLMSSISTGTTVFKKKLFNVILKEYVIFIFTVPLLFMILSSTGYVIFSIQLIMLLISFIKSKNVKSLNKAITIILIFLISLIIILINLDTGNILQNNNIKFWISKLFDFNNVSTSTRIGLMVLGIKVFLKSPIFGVGLFNIGNFFNGLMPDWGYNSEISRYIRNGRWFIGPRNINFIAAGGIIGIIIITIIIIKIYYRISKYNTQFSLYMKNSFIFYLASAFIQGFNSSHVWFIYVWVIPAIFVGYKENDNS